MILKMECDMRSKFLAGAAALAITITTVLAAAGPASAQRWHHRGFGWGAAGLAAGVVGGAVAAATSPFWAPGYYGGYRGYPGYAYAPGYGYDDAYGYEPDYAYGTAPGYTYSPGYAYGQGYGTGGRDDAYCAQRYRSYDPASGTYLGYDGVRHSCP
jgi:BA14K-like protein